MTSFTAPHDCDLPTLGLRVKKGETVEFPTGTEPDGWKPAKPTAPADKKES